MSYLDQYDIQELKSKNQELRDIMDELEEKYKKLEEKHNMCLYKMMKKIQQLERSIDSRNRYIEYLKSVQCGIEKGEKCLLIGGNKNNNKVY